MSTNWFEKSNESAFTISQVQTYSIIDAPASTLELFAHPLLKACMLQPMNLHLLGLLYIIKLNANSENPAYDVVFNPKCQDVYALWK